MRASQISETTLEQNRGRIRVSECCFLETAGNTHFPLLGAETVCRAQPGLGQPSLLENIPFWSSAGQGWLWQQPPVPQRQRECPTVPAPQLPVASSLFSLCRDLLGWVLRLLLGWVQLRYVNCFLTANMHPHILKKKKTKQQYGYQWVIGDQESTRRWKPAAVKALFGISWVGSRSDSFKPGF